MNICAVSLSRCGNNTAGVPFPFLKGAGKVSNYVTLTNIFLLLGVLLTWGGAVALTLSFSHTCLAIVGGLAVGTFTLMHKEKNEALSQNPKFKVGHTDLVGLNNAGYNCWLNAFLQFLQNITSMRAEFSKIAPIKQFFIQYDRDKISGQRVSEYDTQVMRNYLSMMSNGVLSADSSVQEDAFEAFRIVMNIENNTKFIRTITCQRKFLKKGEKKPNVSGLHDQGNDLSFSSSEKTLPIILLPCKDYSNLDTMLDKTDDLGSISLKCTDGATESFSMTQETISFDRPPEDLFVSLRRFEVNDGNLLKVSRSVKLPFKLKLSERFTSNHKSMEYQLSSFICHLGSRIDSGHYIAYILRGSQWYECDDSKIREISATRAENMAKKGYLFHFAKINHN